ncbi:MAG TPA: cytidine deaminase [Flavobacteriales bacterium]|nr:cytidine deaminase [Flavobacteriales bacterium]
MKKIKLYSEIAVFNDFSELPNDIQTLMEQAIAIREMAYAPYSHFRVGAALKLDNGIVVTGNNQENAAYPSGMCAERVAIWAAGSQYPNQKILQMAITARSENHILKQPIPPCGACRQAIAEYEIKQAENIEIYFMGEVGQVYKSDSLHDLLPLIFDSSNL